MNRDPVSILKGPAIGLLVVGIFNGGIGFVTLLSGVVRLFGKETLPVAQSEKIGFLVATIGYYSAALLSVLFAPVIIYGAIQMMKGRKLALAKIAAVLAMLPFTSCCCIGGLPIGIWAWVALSKPELRDLAERG